MINRMSMFAEWFWMRFWRPHLTIVLLGVVVYSFCLGGDFRSLDDFTLIVNNPHLKDWGHAGSLFSQSFFGQGAYYRPLVILTYLLEYQMFGLKPFYFLVDNLILHLFNACLVFALAGRLFHNEKTGFFIAMLFAIHPIQWEAVANIAGRAIVLCASFYFLSVFCLILFRQKNKVRYYFAALASFIPALLAKESAATLPAIAAVYLMWTGSGRKNGIARAAAEAVPFFIIFAVYMFVRRELGITRMFVWPDLETGLFGVLTFGRGLLTFLRLIVVPTGLHYDRSIPYFTDWIDPQLMTTGIGLTALIVGIVLMWKTTRPVTRFFLAWTGIAFLPYSQIIPVRANLSHAAMAEHFLYLPSVGLFALLTVGAMHVFRFLKRKDLVTPAGVGIVFAGMLLFYGLTTVQQAILASRTYAMVRESLKLNPENVRVRNSYAWLLVINGRIDEAEEQYRMALHYEPENAAAMMGLGVTAHNRGDYWTALKRFEAAEQAGSRDPILLSNKSNTLMILKKHCRDRIKDDPGNAGLYYTLGVLHSRSDEARDAIREYQKAVALDSSHPHALYNLASTYEYLGQPDEARPYYEALAALPDENLPLILDALIYLREKAIEGGDEARAFELTTRIDAMRPHVTPMKDFVILRKEERP